MKTSSDMEYQRTFGKPINWIHRYRWRRRYRVVKFFNCLINGHSRFHVDDLSSAHVYLRLKKDQRLEDVSDKTVMECAQLVKANSIEGCKLKEVHVVYTRWSVTLHLLLTCLIYWKTATTSE